MIIITNGETAEFYKLSTQKISIRLKIYKISKCVEEFRSQYDLDESYKNILYAKIKRILSSINYDINRMTEEWKALIFFEIQQTAGRKRKSL